MKLFARCFFGITFLGSVAALSGACIYAGGLSGLSGLKAPTVVPADQAPPITAGHGWYCADVHERTSDSYNDPHPTTRSYDYCERTLDKCQADAAAADNSSVDGHTVTSDVGSCTSQATAICSYSFGMQGAAGAWSCYRGTPSCSKDLDMEVMGDQKKSQCTPYK